MILLLDEPELSLSLVWQETLVPDLISCGSNKLIVATHSPFILNNPYIKETIGKGDFSQNDIKTVPNFVGKNKSVIDSWAYENGITTGADETHFNPAGLCTRGQAVTFLYRV